MAAIQIWGWKKVLGVIIRGKMGRAVNISFVTRRRAMLNTVEEGKRKVKGDSKST